MCLVCGYEVPNGIQIRNKAERNWSASTKRHPAATNLHIHKTHIHNQGVRYVVIFFLLELASQKSCEGIGGILQFTQVPIALNTQSPM